MARTSCFSSWRSVHDRDAVRRAQLTQLSVALLFGLGLSLGLAVRHSSLLRECGPQALSQAGGATALFVAGCGAFGYATRADLSGVTGPVSGTACAHHVRRRVDLRARSGRAVIYSILGYSFLPVLPWPTFSGFGDRRISNSARSSPRRSSSTRSTFSNSSCRCSAEPS